MAFLPLLRDHLYSRTTWSCPNCGIFTSIKRPPLFKDHLVVSQLWLYHAFLPLLRDHLYSKTTFFLAQAWSLHCIHIRNKLGKLCCLLYLTDKSPTTHTADFRNYMPCMLLVTMVSAMFCRQACMSNIAYQ